MIQLRSGQKSLLIIKQYKYRYYVWISGKQHQSPGRQSSDKPCERSKWDMRLIGLMSSNR